MTSGPSENPISGNQSTLSAEVSPARISALRALEKAWMENLRAFSSNCSDWGVRYDRHSSSWRMSQLSLFGGSIEFVGNFPPSGMIVHGRLYRPESLEPRTFARDGGYWPTLLATEHDMGERMERHVIQGRHIHWNLETAIKHGLTKQEFVRLPTLTASDAIGGAGLHGRGGMNLRTAIGGRLNPEWAEWFMGYPSGHTELEPSEMQLYRNVRAKHSKD